MAHNVNDHPDAIIYDEDNHFIVDPITRDLTGDTLTLMQYDHDSEIITFEIPHYIEGHDMSECDVVEVHYTNTSSGTSVSTRNSTPDVYRITDLQVQDNDTLTCTWPISQNATLYAGVTKFLLKFICEDDDGLPTYIWHTNSCEGIRVLPGFNNVESALNIRPDALAYYRQLLSTMEAKIEEQTALANELRIAIDGFDYEARVVVDGTATFRIDTGDAPFGDNVIETETVGQSSIAAGAGVQSIGKYSLATGVGTSAIGEGSTAMGGYTTASGNRSFATGNGSIASGYTAFAAGFGSTASGDFSVATGEGSNATDESSVAMGRGCTAEGLCSVAMGDDNYIRGNASFAAGEGGLIEGSASASFGEGNEIIGDHSFVAGKSNTCGQANFVAMFGEGNGASFNHSFVAGQNCLTQAAHSVAMGLGLRANTNCQHVSGKYNVPDTGNQYAEIVGWGTEDTRKNIRTLRYDGTATYNGKVYINGSISENNRLVAVSELPGPATASSAGLVKVGDTMTVSEDGTINVPEATHSRAGLMSSTDKTRLNNFEPDGQWTNHGTGTLNGLSGEGFEANSVYAITVKNNVPGALDVDSQVLVYTGPAHNNTSFMSESVQTTCIDDGSFDDAGGYMTAPEYRVYFKPVDRETNPRAKYDLEFMIVETTYEVMTYDESANPGLYPVCRVMDDYVQVYAKRLMTF